MTSDHKHNLRWVVTVIDQSPMQMGRMLAHAAQGRNTFETEAECQRWIDAAKRNSPSQLRQVHGPAGVGTLEPRKVLCHETGDPRGIYFDDDQPIDRLVRAVMRQGDTL